MKTCWRCQFDMEEEGYILRCANCDWTETRDFSAAPDPEHYRALRDTVSFIAEKCAELAQELPDECDLLIEIYVKAQELAETWDDKTMTLYDLDKKKPQKESPQPQNLNIRLHLTPASSMKPKRPDG